MKVKTLEILGFIGVFLIGVLLYFAYGWSQENQFIAMIAPVNGSLWELMKTPFFSVLIYGIIVYLLAKGEHRNLLFAKVLSAIVTSIFCLMMYFGYTAIFDQHILLDALVFFVAVVLGQFLSLGILSIQKQLGGLNFLALILLMAITMTFATFTYEPPQHDFFRDQETNTYGIPY